MMDPSTLIAASKSLITIRDFVCGNGLNQAVCTITGDVHLDAAKVALETSRHSAMPRDRINSVITHLEAAHIAYARVHGNLGYIQKRAGWMAIENSVSKDVWVCCLMALCYAWLGDPKMAAHSLNLANRAFINQKTAISLYASNAAERLASAALLTMSVFNIMSYNPKELIAEEDFKQFRRSLNESSNQQ